MIKTFYIKYRIQDYLTDYYGTLDSKKKNTEKK